MQSPRRAMQSLRRCVFVLVGRFEVFGDRFEVLGDDSKSLGADAKSSGGDSKSLGADAKSPGMRICPCRAIRSAWEVRICLCRAIRSLRRGVFVLVGCVLVGGAVYSSLSGGAKLSETLRKHLMNHLYNPIKTLVYR